jgi:hypothetical protein
LNLGISFRNLKLKNGYFCSYQGSKEAVALSTLPKGPRDSGVCSPYRHLRGYHQRTPNQAKALLPEGYQPRPPRRRSQPEAEADEDSDEEEADNPPVYQDVSDDEEEDGGQAAADNDDEDDVFVPAAAQAVEVADEVASEAGSARTASTVIQTPLVTPVVSAQGSPVLHRWAPVQDELYRGEGVITPAISVRADETGTLPPPTPEPSRQGSRTLTRSGSRASASSVGARKRQSTGSISAEDLAAAGPSGLQRAVTPGLGKRSRTSLDMPTPRQVTDFFIIFQFYFSEFSICSRLLLIILNLR